MNTLNDNFSRILTMINEAGNVAGRIKLQKIIYILKNKGISFDEKFRYHYYGPYSQDLQLEIEELVDREFLIEESANPYIYKIKQQDSFHKVSDIVDNGDLIRLLNKKDYRELELVSTIYFLQNEGIKNKNAIKKKMQILKPRLKELIDTAFELKKEIDAL